MGNSKTKEDCSISSEPLTPSELDLIRTSWDAVKDKDYLGIRLMINMFQSDSEIKYLWIFASNLETEEEMLHNSELKYHAKKVTNTITRIINFLTSPTASSSDQVDLIRLGKRHFHYGLKRDYFIYFENSLVNCMEKSINNETIYDEETKKAWRKFVQFIFTHYADGMKIEEIEIEELEKAKSRKYSRVDSNKHLG